MILFRHRLQCLTFVVLCLHFIGTNGVTKIRPRAYPRRALPFQNQDVALALYRAILESSESASGTLRIGLREFAGRTRGSHLGQGALWAVESGTVAKVTFNFRGGRWSDLTLDFGNHPLNVQIAEDTAAPGALRIGKIVYHSDGTVRDLIEPGGVVITGVVRRGQSHSTSVGFFTELLSSIRLAPQLRILLAGNEESSGPLIINSITVNGAEKENILLALRPMTTLPLGQRGGAGCAVDSLTLSGSVPLSFNALSFEPSIGRLDATMGSFNTGLTKGCLGADETEFRLATGAQFQASSLKFGQSKHGGGSHLSLSAGALSGALSPGSRVELARAGDRKSILTAAGNNAGVQGDRFEFSIKDDGTREFGLTSGRIRMPSAIPSRRAPILGLT